MNTGGEPERDETGLPPVHIEIPDDARELDREVQAYYRELRAQRRRQRRRRMHGSLARDGIVLPLLACCLILALITGTLLTVFTATSDQNLPGARGNAKPTAGPRSAPASPVTPLVRNGITYTGRPLPDGTLNVVSGSPIPMRALYRTMLILVPPACRCTATLRWLVKASTAADASAYLVGTPTTMSEVDELYAHVTAGDSQPIVLAAEDAHGVLQAKYGLGLTAIMVPENRTAAYLDNVTISGNQRWLTLALTAT